LNLKSVTDWIALCRNRKRLHDIPAAPDKFYKNQGGYHGKTGWVKMKKIDFC
jgi:hypothetical protein